MKHLKILTVFAAAVFAGAAVVADQKDTSVKEEFHPELIHRPQDVAPPEHIIVPRPAVEARPKGTLLRTAQHRPRHIDTDELLRRKYDLYAGRIVTHSLPGAAGPVSRMAVQEPAKLHTTDGLNFAAIAYWSFISACTVTGLWLLAKVLCNRRRPENVQHGRERC